MKQELKRLSNPLLLVFLVALNFSFTNYQPGKWERLGTRVVNFRTDRDEIPVTASDGAFSKLKIFVKGAGINMHRMVVHFGNGEKEEIEMRENIPGGGESRVIDLPGNKRIIQKVALVYDTKNWANKRAEVVLWGKH